MRHPLRLLATLTAAIAATTLLATPAAATPPNIPSKATAQTELNALTVATEGSTSGYSRDLFPHWITISGTCNTRGTVLKRDGNSVATDSACAATSGSWYSPYDGATWTAAGDVDIDHVVPLVEAWRSGASTWTTAKRQQYANDLTRPQLIAVTDNVNQSKGDQDPSTWQPSRTAYRCTYARTWIAVKYYWSLKLQSQSLEPHPQLCELLSAQAGVLEHNVSAEVAGRYKNAALANVAALTGLIRHHLPETGDITDRLAPQIIMAIGAVWTHSRPSPGMLAAYEADPRLADMRLEFTPSLLDMVATLVAGTLTQSSASR